MKQFKKLAMFIVGLWCCMAASAYDFKDGGFSYNILSETDLTVEVAKGPSDGDVSIPSAVAYNGQNYSVTSIGYQAFSGCKGLTSITIPESITSIGNNAFYGCTGLTSITIPGSVTSIGDNAFYGCTGLTSITIPGSVTSIGNNAFRNCRNLTSFIIPEGVTSIGSSAFQYCTGLTSITIPGSVTSIGNYAFSSCIGLTSVTILEGVTSIGSEAFSGCIGLTSVTILEGVTSIGSEAFSGCTRLTSVTIPGSVTSIGSSAFSGCSGLTSVTIPGSVTRIDNSAFSGCTGLTSVTILEGVTSIDEYAFVGCEGLTSVTIPESVTSIATSTFAGCTSLPIENHVRYADKWALEVDDNTLEQYTLKNNTKGLLNTFYGCKNLTSITIPESVTYICGAAFYDCSSLASITIPEGVTSIDGSAFYNCSSLTSVTIPASVTSIDGSAFYNCSSLTSVTIPEGVTNISDNAFNGCSALTEITCKAMASPTCGRDVFKGVDKSIPLYVPKGSVIKYKAADVWRDFVIIREIAEAGSDVYLTINDGSKGNVKLKVNDDQPYFSLKIEPETGWHIHSVTFNDGDVTAELSADGEYVTPVIGTDSQLGIVYAQGSSSINSVSDSKIRVWASGNSVIVEGAEYGKTINVYTIDGIMAASVNADSDRVVIPLQSGDVYIVKIGEQTLKVAL